MQGPCAGLDRDIVDKGKIGVRGLEDGSGASYTRRTGGSASARKKKR